MENTTLRGRLEKTYDAVSGAIKAGGAQPGVAAAFEAELEHLCDELEKCGQIYDAAADALEQLIGAESDMEEHDPPSDDAETRRQTIAVLQSLGTADHPEDADDRGEMDCELDLAASTGATRPYKAPRRV